MDKKPEQQEFLELEMRAAEKAKPFDILTVVTMIAFMFIFMILLFVLPDKDFSEQENRTLHQFPDANLDGSFTSDIAKYLADQFPARDYFIGIKGAAEIGLRKGENNGVILAKDDYLVTRDVNNDFDMLNENITSAAVFADAMKKMNVPFNIAVAGRTYDVMSSYYSANVQTEESRHVWDYIEALNSVSPQLKYINIFKPLQERPDKDFIYYKTDHHWTTLGAYYAYAEIMKNFREDNAQPLSSFHREVASDSFYGTTWSKAGMKWIKPDSIEYFRYDGDEDFVTEIVDTGEIFDGFYVRSYLDAKDKYSSFIGGNNARVNITKRGGENRSKLLIMKDSFAHCLVPFLAYHYDLVILDMRYYADSVAKLVISEGIDRVLILNNVDNLMNSNLYGILNLGLESAVADYVKSQFPIKNIYINGNPIEEYKIVCPDIPEYITAAELIASTILTRSGYAVEIVKTDASKSIVLSAEDLPASGLIEITVDGDNLTFRHGSKVTITEMAELFVSEYLKNSAGSFNFGDGFRYSDIKDDMIMIMPEGDDNK